MTAATHSVGRPPLFARARRVIAALAGVVALLLLGANGASALEFLKHASDSNTVNAIEARGKIEPGDAVALQAFIAKLPAKSLTVIHLNSSGGSFDEGLALGRYFHRARIRTAVTGKGVTCSGACTSAFLGGRDAKTGEAWRAKGSTALLGFHSFRIDWADRDYAAQDMSVAIARTQRMTLAMADYLTEVKASLEFLRAHLKTSAAGMTYMSNADALALGIYVVDDKTGDVIVPESLKARPQY